MSSKPGRSQVAATKAVVQWYLASYFRTEDDLGTAQMFCDPRRVGAFAADPVEVARRDGLALFRVLVTAAMFQRRQDAQIMRILQGIPSDVARELADPRALLRLATTSTCSGFASNVALRSACDLYKQNGTADCERFPGRACHLKEHSVLLKRYGDFGKVPTSAALMLRDAGVSDLEALRDQVLATIADPSARALELERAICSVWRVHRKLAALFLSAISNPDLSGNLAVWAEGIDWTRYVVIDSNTTAFLGALGFEERIDYDARHEFITMLAERIDLAQLEPSVRSFNPRLVQQAMYMFMSASNRRASERDCSRDGVVLCRDCPKIVRKLCPMPP